MQNPMNRTLTILADGEPVTGYEGLRELCDRIENVIAKG